MDLRKTNKRKLTVYEWLILSLGLHISFALSLFLYQQPPKTDDRIEVQLIEKKPDLEQLKPQVAVKDDIKQIVDQDEKAMNDEVDEKTKFLSAHNQKVVKQTVSKNQGDFKNRANKDNQNGESGAEKKIAKAKKIDMDSLSPQYDISKAVQQMEAREKKTFEQTQKQQVAKPGRPGSESSSTIDYIKDLDPGLETLLSTREFVYYTYYARIRKQLNQFWSPKVKEKITKMYREGRQIASTDDKITKCLVTLDKIGNLVKVQIIGISGIRELDEAAIEAFKLAAPFPNPPNGMVDDDGNIKVRWDFILEM